jgi:hypothetical protein
MKNKIIIAALLASLIPAVATAAQRGPRKGALASGEFSVENLSPEDKTYYATLSPDAQEAFRKGTNFRRNRRRAQMAQRKEFDPTSLSAENKSFYDALSPECKEAFKKGFEARRDMIRARGQKRLGMMQRKR